MASILADFFIIRTSHRDTEVGVAGKRFLLRRRDSPPTGCPFFANFPSPPQARRASDLFRPTIPRSPLGTSLDVCGETIVLVFVGFLLAVSPLLRVGDAVGRPRTNSLCLRPSAYSFGYAHHPRHLISLERVAVAKWPWNREATLPQASWRQALQATARFDQREASRTVALHFHCALPVTRNIVCAKARLK